MKLLIMQFHDASRYYLLKLACFLCVYV